jgi:hypothetical protein
VLLLISGWLFAIALGAMISSSQWVGLIALGGLSVVGLVGLLGTTSLLFVVTVAALIQPPLGNAAGIPQITLAEALVPLLLIILLTRSRTTRAEAVSATPWAAMGQGAARTINLAMLTYATVLAINLIRTKGLQAISPGVNRTYYDYIVALALYLLIYLALTRQQITFQSLLRIVFWISLVVSLVGVVAVAFSLPLHLGALRYSVYDYGTGAIRVGFLETSGTIGLALAVIRPMRFRWLALPFFATALIMSGGRAAFVGAILGIAVYLVVTRRAIRLVIAGGIAVILLFAFPAIHNVPQAKRITHVNTKAFTSDQRGRIYHISLREFVKHPIVGTGIGQPSNVTDPNPAYAKFYNAQLEVGGHGTYAALLKNLGLVGFLPFAWALLIALIALGRIARFSNAAGFLFIVLASQAVALLAGGNGSDVFYFFMLGAAAAVLKGVPDAEPEAEPEPVPLPAPLGRAVTQM